jgi:UDP:flavonoid glycosyltransferase YjiC (YdhE family)
LPNKTRILFLAEAMSLSHVGRSVYFGSLLDPARFDVAVATDPRAERYVTNAGLAFLPLPALAAGVALKRAGLGKPLFELKELRRYAEDDRRALGAFGPDLAVGDMRQSLAVSAPSSRIPFATITNSYWQNCADRFRVPYHPWMRWMGRSLFEVVARSRLPQVARELCAPLNQLRESHGLAPIGDELWSPHGLGDYVLHADHPDIHPFPDGPAHHFQIGPALWNLPCPLPPWWEKLRTDVPTVYVNLGSSGSPAALQTVVDGLGGLKLQVVLGSCGHRLRLPKKELFHFAPYLPNDTAIRSATAVVCNGGSTTGYQCLAGGAPFLGLVDNAEQGLSMQGFERAGVGIRLERFGLTPKQVASDVGRILSEPAFAARARAFASRFSAEARKRDWNDLVFRLAAGDEQERSAA